MDIAIDTPEFQGRGLAVRPASWFRGPRVVVDGELVKGRRSRFLVRDNHGQEVTVRLIWNRVDPVPNVMVGDRSISLATPLKWYEAIWIVWAPLLLVFYGKLLGMVVAFVVLRKSMVVFRGEGGKAKKFLITGLISLGAVVAYSLLTEILFSLVRRL